MTDILSRIDNDCINTRAEATQWAADAYLEIKRLREVLGEARLQLEYMQEKFHPTGSGNAVLARINAALAGAV
jgi:hypothetical protein